MQADIPVAVIALGTSAGGMAKIVVDVIRQSVDPDGVPMVVWPLLALVFSALYVVLIMMQGSPVWNQQTISTAALASLGGMVGAMAITEVHNKTQAARATKRARKVGDLMVAEGNIDEHESEHGGHSRS